MTNGGPGGEAEAVVDPDGQWQTTEFGILGWAGRGASMYYTAATDAALRVTTGNQKSAPLHLGAHRCHSRITASLMSINFRDRSSGVPK